MKENVIQEKSFKFALSILKLCKDLKQHNEFEIAKQLLRSATSVGANVEESTAWQTKKDFLTKIYIAAKEARESRYRLRLVDQWKLSSLNVSTYLVDIEHIINILTNITKTTVYNLQNKK